jgi:UrcA family protein
MSNVIPRRFAAATISLAAIAISVCALAGPRPGTDIPVEESDLDLGTWSGVTMLYHRLQDAAMMSCDPSGQSKVLPYFNRPESGDCYSDKLYTLLMTYENSALLNIHDKIQLEPIIIE